MGGGVGGVNERTFKQLGWLEIQSVLKSLDVSIVGISTFHSALLGFDSCHLVFGEYRARRFQAREGNQFREILPAPTVAINTPRDTDEAAKHRES